MEVKYHDPDLGQPVPSITIWWDRNDVTRTSLLDLHINHGVYKAEVTPDGRMSLITLDRVTVTHMLGFSWILGNKQEINTFLSFATRAVTSLGKLLSKWCGDISCKLVWKLSREYEDNRMNSAGAAKTVIRHQTCQDPEKLCSLFQQTFSMKSIVSRPLECNFSFSLSALSSL